MNPHAPCYQLENELRDKIENLERQRDDLERDVDYYRDERDQLQDDLDAVDIQHADRVTLAGLIADEMHRAELDQAIAELNPSTSEHNADYYAAYAKGLDAALTIIRDR